MVALWVTQGLFAKSAVDKVDSSVNRTLNQFSKSEFRLS